MKTISILRKNWWIKGFEHSDSSCNMVIKTIMTEMVTENTGWLNTEMPNVVQEVLFENNLLDPAVVETGEADYCKWVSDCDWVYRCSFLYSKVNSTVYLECKGLDTKVDIFLNGTLIAQHNSMFLPERIDITKYLEEGNNELFLYFYSHSGIIEELKNKIPDRYEGRINALALFRKPQGDFNSHGGAIPYFSPIGVFDDICLIEIDRCEILFCNTDIRFNKDFSSANLLLCLECKGNIDDIIPKFILKNPDGSINFCVNGTTIGWSKVQDDKAEYIYNIDIDSPELWWPKNYGDQPLYTLETLLCSIDGISEYDREEKIIGFRNIENVGDIKFRINGRVIKMWGSCITPMWGISHRWQQERGYRILDFAEKANMNTLRLWGPSQPYHQEFYDQCDRLGILVWQEFHTWGAHMPDLPEYKNSVLTEAENMIRRLKHHPCIFMWCGGNEQIYMVEIFDKKAMTRFGHDIIVRDLKALTTKLDPYRYYHISSPSMGQYANEAEYGDTHGSRASFAYLPGESYSHFFSEDIRTSIPELKSLKRFIKSKDLWPDNFKDFQPYGVTKPLPESWMRRTINHMEEAAGPYELFYDAVDPASLIYKINAAASYDIRLIINKMRQGKPFYNSMANRSCNGYLIWKLNTSWPQIYCALVDYYLEPGQVYYTVRRAYMPVHISIDLRDHIYIWGTNDTSKDFWGRICIEVFDLAAEEIIAKCIFHAGIPADDSLILKNLDKLGQYPLASLIHVFLFQVPEDIVVDEDFQYIKPERKITFPQAKISLEKVDKNSIRVTADRFARCVELSGDCNGESFGWHFEDNYFDLMPGQSRIIKYFGNYISGTICAKAFYSPFVASLDLQEGKEK
ncbi:MAG: hypothetical protein LBE13_02240 [Bacteroidales bacterium]|jgi:hypothetical protein|nr:hypothetical protein [Bacteroidales bacterium]